jgi:hypothetical protein
LTHWNEKHLTATHCDSSSKLIFWLYWYIWKWEKRKKVHSIENHPGRLFEIYIFYMFCKYCKPLLTPILNSPKCSLDEQQQQYGKVLWVFIPAVSSTTPSWCNIISVYEWLLLCFIIIRVVDSYWNWRRGAIKHNVRLFTFPIWIYYFRAIFDFLRSSHFFISFDLN